MENPLRLFLKAYATWAYANLHTFNHNIDLSDTYDVQVAIFDTYIGQSVVVAYFCMIDAPIQFTNMYNLYENHDIFPDVIDEVIAEYDED